MTDSTPSSSRPKEGQGDPDYGEWLMTLEDRLVAAEEGLAVNRRLILQIVAAVEVLYPEVRDDFRAIDGEGWSV